MESHFIAGVSGGRKAICPGLVGDRTTHVFHSAEFIAAEGARDLNLEGNPLHQESLWVARRAGVDYIVNVTLDTEYRITGVFAGDLEAAHAAAFEFLKGYAAIPVAHEYDVVLTHGGFVAVNHYQSVKTALAAMPALRQGGTLILAAANTDIDPIGSRRYQTLLHLMKLIGPDRFLELIFSPDWTFVPDQWEVQAWSTVLRRTGPDGMVYYSPYLSPQQVELIPGTDGNGFLPAGRRHSGDPGDLAAFFEAALEAADTGGRKLFGRAPRVAFMLDGPYGIVSREGVVAKTTA